MITNFSRELIARIGDYATVNERKQCREAAKMFSPISENYVHAEWSFDGPICDLDLRFSATLKLKPMLKSQVITVNRSASMSDAKQLVDAISSSKNRGIDVKLNINNNHGVLSKCIEAGIHVDYCDYRFANERAQIIELATLDLSAVHTLYMNLVGFVDIDTTKFMCVKELVLVDRHCHNILANQALINVASHLYICHGESLGQVYMDALKGSTMLKTLRFASMDFFMMMSTDIWRTFIDMLQNIKNLVSVHFYWRTVQDPNIVQFVKAILGRVPQVQVLIGWDGAFEITKSQRICAHLIKRKLTHERVVFLKDSEEKAYESRDYAQLLAELALIDEGTSMLYAGFM